MYPLFVVEMFLNEKLVYDSRINFGASFVCLKDFQSQKTSKVLKKVKSSFFPKKVSGFIKKAGKIFLYELLPKKTK